VGVKHLTSRRLLWRQPAHEGLLGGDLRGKAEPILELLDTYGDETDRCHPLSPTGRFDRGEDIAEVQLAPYWCLGTVSANDNSAWAYQPVELGHEPVLKCRRANVVKHRETGRGTESG
jgi:hypothetical protein